MLITKPRGTSDNFYELDGSTDIVINTVKMLAKLNGFYEIETPIFESIDVFKRSIGQTSNIINKEFYEFIDKGDRHMALRPEMTASIARAVVENKILDKQPLPFRCFYVGPMFRYERPQSGRMRQFTQFGIECIGADSYYDDVECLLFALSILESYQYEDYIIKINNICGFETRQKWIEALKEYLSAFKDKLSEDSLKRLETNPLRILDDKVDGKKDFIVSAPKIKQFATLEENKYFEKIKTNLDLLKINYIEDETLVRGLDYYSNFIFEIESTSKDLIGQPTLIGGGRYNNLFSEFGGKNVGSVGFAMGIERFLVALKDNKILNSYKNAYKICDAVIANIAEDTNPIALIVARMLRMAGISCICNHSVFKLEKHFKIAENSNAQYVLIIGPEEIRRQVVIVKDQITKKQEEVSIDDLIKYFTKKTGRAS